MSSHCRCFRTAISGTNAKLLIREGGATVAESRRAATKATQRNNNHKQREVDVACERCDKNTKKFAHGDRLEPKSTFVRVTNGDGPKIQAATDDEKVVRSNI